MEISGTAEIMVAMMARKRTAERMGVTVSRAASAPWSLLLVFDPPDPDVCCCFGDLGLNLLFSPVQKCPSKATPSELLVDGS